MSTVERTSHRTWGKRADLRSHRLHQPGGVCRFHRVGPGHAVHDLDGVRMIFAGRYDEHHPWMIRSFSLIMAGVMLRAWSGVYDALSAAGIVDLWFTRRPADVVNAA